MSAVQRHVAQSDVTESQIATILQYRYGDGMVYLPKHKPRLLYSIATERGFIDGEGYLTRKGRALIARYKFL
ncbi:MAG: hypothetical protein ACI9XC_001721 [Gammaproteobacteria bacterium]|jgi:hypothetical protein